MTHGADINLRLISYEANHAAKYIRQNPQHKAQCSQTAHSKITTTEPRTMGQSLSIKGSSVVDANIRCVSFIPSYSTNYSQGRTQTWKSSQIHRTSTGSFNHDNGAGITSKVQKTAPKHTNSVPLSCGNHNPKAVVSNEILVRTPPNQHALQQRKLTSINTQECSCADCQWNDIVMAIPGFDIFEPETLEFELTNTTSTTTLL